MEKRRWVLKEFNLSEDGLSLIGLRRRVFYDVVPDLVNEFALAWEFQQNPAGKPICVLAQDHDTLAGSYLVFPSLFEVTAKEMLLAQSADTMTHPEYRRQGIFVNLAKEVYTRMEEFGFKLVWGFPNDNSRPGLIEKLDWFDIDMLPTYVKPCQGSFWSASVGYFLQTRVTFSARQKVYKIENFGQDFDSLWERSKPYPPIIQIRDSKFLNWRYKTLATRTYDVYALYEKDLLQGYIVARLMSYGRNLGAGLTRANRRKRLVSRLMSYGGILGMAIVDVFPHSISQNQFEILLSEIEKECKHKKVALLFTYLSPYLRNHLKKTHFYKLPQIISPKKWYFGARVIDSNLSLDFWKDKLNWYITYGDTDII